MDEDTRKQLQAELAANREALLAIVSKVDERALSLPTRNPEWSVRDVIAHVLASDADLIALLEPAGRAGAASVEGRSYEEHEREMARWSDATPDALPTLGVVAAVLGLHEPVARVRRTWPFDAICEAKPAGERDE